jgi:hypothetical protein
MGNESPNMSRSCSSGGGELDSEGACSLGSLVHCPICFGCEDCSHFVAGWDDGEGYIGPSFPELEASPEDPIWSVPEAVVQEVLGELSSLWPLYVESEGSPNGDDLFEGD